MLVAFVKQKTNEFYYIFSTTNYKGFIFCEEIFKNETENKNTHKLVCVNESLDSTTTKACRNQS
jgi:hypothetical protein